MKKIAEVKLKKDCLLIKADNEVIKRMVENITPILNRDKCIPNKTKSIKL